jgi:hypothetical protein
MSEDRGRTRTYDMAIAYHEAGHAVAIHQVGWQRAIRSKGVSIEQGTDGPEGAASAGYAGIKVLRPWKAGRIITLEIARHINDEVVALFAGAIAQRKFSRRGVRAAGKYDTEAAIERASLLNRSIRTREAYLRWRHVVAEELIEEYWPMVEDLAAELVRRRVLSGKELSQWFRRWEDKRLNSERINRHNRRLMREEKKREEQLAKVKRAEERRELQRSVRAFMAYIKKRKPPSPDSAAKQQDVRGKAKRTADRRRRTK